MNATQRKYLETRLNKIVNDKKKEVDGKYPLLDVSFESRINAIREGKAKLKPLVQLSKYTDLLQAYEFSHDDEENNIKNKRIELKNKIDKEAQNVLDAMYLGNSPDVKEMLTALENISI